MFIGVQNNIPCFLGKSGSELENMPCVVFDEIQEVDFAEMYNGKIYTTVESLIMAKQEFIRSLRNFYLEKYVDPVVSNPIRWSDMTETEKKPCLDYRRYLLDYTKSSNWYGSNPLTFEEYLK